MVKQQKQVPGVYRRRVGDALITVVNDGFLDIPFEILRGVSLSDMQALMRATFREGPPRLTVNAFVIELGGRTVLVDAGGGSTTIYSMGLLIDNLTAAGFLPIVSILSFLRISTRTTRTGFWVRTARRCSRVPRLWCMRMR